MMYIRLLSAAFTPTVALLDILLCGLMNRINVSKKHTYKHLINNLDIL